MNKLEQAARQALEALETAIRPSYQRQFISRVEAITALREALAEQAEQVTGSNGSKVSLETEAQEPVGWYSHKGGFNECGEGQPLYAAPVRTKDLTDEEIDKAFWGNGDTEIEGCRAVIAADREKNK